MKEGVVALRMDPTRGLVLGVSFLLLCGALVAVSGTVAADHTDEYDITFYGDTNEPGEESQVMVEAQTPFDARVDTFTQFSPGWSGADQWDRQPAGPGSFDFSVCNPDDQRAYGKDINGDNDRGSTDVSWIPYVDGITVEERVTKVEHDPSGPTAEEDLTVRGESQGDEVVIWGDGCVVLPEEPGWYQIGYHFGPQAPDKAYLSHFIQVGEKANIGPKPTEDHTASITFEDQESDGTTVEVQNLESSHGGFLAVYDTHPSEAGPGNIIGTSGHLAHDDDGSVTIALNEKLEESGKVWVVPHVDINRDRTFDYVDSGGDRDRPYTGSNPYQVDEIDGDAIVTESATVEVVEGTSNVEFQVSEFSAPDAVREDESYQVETTVENLGEDAGTATVEYRLGGEKVETVPVEVAAGGSKTVTIDVVEIPVDPGSYEHGMHVEDSSVTGEITIEELVGPVIELTVEAPSGEVAVAEDLIIDARIANTGDKFGSALVRINLEGETIKQETDLGIDPGQEENVSAYFTLDEPGEYEYEVIAGDQSETGSFKVVEDAEEDDSNGEDGAETDEASTTPTQGGGPGPGPVIAFVAMVATGLAVGRWRRRRSR